MTTGVTKETLATAFPVLFHMAEAGSWPSIQRYGLLSTSSILDLFEVKGGARRAIESAHRPELVPVTHPAYGAAIIRDQKPMSDSGLERALTDGTTPREWYEFLNRHVFFWLATARLDTLLGARAYRNRRQTVLTLDTASLLKEYGPKVLLSPINSGATKPFPHPRSMDTIRPMAAYDFDDWFKRRKGRDPVVELLVRDGILDVSRFLIRAEERGAGKPTKVLFK